MRHTWSLDAKSAVFANGVKQSTLVFIPPYGLAPTLAPSWIIRGVGGVTSDLHLTGSRPTENPLPRGEGLRQI